MLQKHFSACLSLQALILRNRTPTLQVTWALGEAGNRKKMESPLQGAIKDPRQLTAILAIL